MRVAQFTLKDRSNRHVIKIEMEIPQFENCAEPLSLIQACKGAKTISRLVNLGLIIHCFNRHE